VSFARTSMTNQASIVLMKFLADLSRRIGVGKHVYVVGGAVRNFVIDEPVKDIDVVIDSVALKGKDSEWFGNQLAAAIPAKTSVIVDHRGVVKVKALTDWMLGETNLLGEEVEIANARTEQYGEGGYTPTSVGWSDINEDMTRRDFTFNTLLWRLHDLAEGPDKAEIVDLTGCGLKDLEEGVMRCPSSPDKTFVDDPSRMMRAIKFLVKYKFKLSLEVRRSIEKNKEKLRNIPPSHLSNMLINTFLREPTGKKALMEMKKLGLLDVIKDIAKKDKSFRAALAKWVDREAKVEFIFDLMDFGLPSGKRLTFLDRFQIERVREVTVGLSADASDQYVKVLNQPGKVMDTRTLMLEFNLKGKAIQQIGERARVHLLNDPILATDSRRLTQRVREDLMSNNRKAYRDQMPGGIGDKKQPSDFDPKALAKGIKVEMEHTDDSKIAQEIAIDHLTEDPKYYDKLEVMEKKASVVGDGTSGVGLFIRLPGHLAEQYPSLGDEDSSPAHITFLYVGDVKGRETEFLEAVGFVVAANANGPVQAVIEPLDYFIHPALERRVALTRVRFSMDMGQLRDRIRQRLLDLKFEVQDGFPLVYQPHVTLQYMDDMDSGYGGVVPTGSWMVDEIEVWGLPQVHQIPLTRIAKTFTLDVGDPLLMGKYLNSPGRIEGFKNGPKGDPMVVVRKPSKKDENGKGTKKEVKLFKVRYDKEKAQQDKKAARTPLRRMQCPGQPGNFYLMDLNKDVFVHFTPLDRAKEILQSGKLLMDPPHRGFGIYAVCAVSAVWGTFVPEVQSSHIKGKDIVAVVFKTGTIPQYGRPEEVIWKQDVSLTNPRIVSFAKGRGMIRSLIDEDSQVHYKVPSWCEAAQRLASRYLKDGSVQRIASRYLRAARPIRIDKGAVSRLLDRLYRQLQKLAARNPKDQLGVSRQSLVTDSLILQDVLGNRKEVFVALTSDRGVGSPVLSGGFGHLKTGPNKGAPIVIVVLNGTYTWEGVANPKVSRHEMQVILMHELTHAADAPKGSKGPIQGRIPTSEELNLKEYYNDPHEVRAFMRELYEAMAPLVRKVMVTSLGTQWGLSRILNNFLRSNTIWGEIKPHLTRKNKQKILKGLVTAFQDEDEIT